MNTLNNMTTTVTFNTTAVARHPDLATSFLWEDEMVEADVVITPDIVHSHVEVEVVAARRFNDEGEVVETLTSLDAVCAAAGITLDALAAIGPSHIADLDQNLAENCA